MKKLLVVLLALSLAVPVITWAEERAANPKEFVVYLDKNAKDNHYIPSGWIGDYGDIKMIDQSAENPHTGTTSIQFVYSAKKTQGQGWAGVYWQNPASNWGGKKGGFDLTGMTKLTFWARGAKGDEVLQKVMVGMSNKDKTYPDTASVEMGPLELTSAWKQYTVNLVGKDISYINGGFGWSTTADLNPEGATFYIDDIKFEADPDLKPQGKKQEAMPFYIYVDRSTAGNHFIPSGYMGDFGDIKYNGASKEDAYLGDTCIKIIYSGKAAQGARWAGIFWQNPANNWGSVDAGFDLSLATKLTFWARGAVGGERIEEFKVGGIMGEFSDSDSATIGPVLLNKEWTQYTIDLKGKDMSYIIGGFAWSTNVDNNPEGATFYLDEIKFE
ncbi:MAG: hypothetical protein KKC39_03960 [Candidatus Omnitrophica bacterium]|nr:hypothetical protein [Candidatus Omnitrophota bacterium]MBU4303995.1 hypothetical protein [Candidatus Omnitrophota bacterium]MBU4418322.1 hypothetical protein [Candidatus Omnitrophota bacterium]MBU4467880.1 hypothetical protein [Candidatus Omnitrophota bacterium]MCG2707099.1 hypothetical protein [Candidatus Omnitrophota bacterium]